MKKIFFLLVFILNSVFSFGQFRGNNWCFSDSIGLNFNSGSPIPFETVLSNYGSGDVVENSSCISDENGQLIFYSDGRRVWDRNNDSVCVMGTSNYSPSITNGTIYLPFPGHEDSLIYQFYINRTGPPYRQKLYYSIFNKNLRNGFGDIFNNQANLLAVDVDSISEQLTAIKHGNGRDWWIIAKKSGANDFLRLLLTENGIEFIDSSTSGGLKLQSPTEGGEISSSPDGTKIGEVFLHLRKFQILNFDRCTGEISSLFSDTVFVSNSFSGAPYGCSFSPNSSKFYYSTWDTLYQIELNPGVNQFDSKIIGIDSSGSYVFRQHELAPDGKIYIVFSTFIYPNTIYSPLNMNLCVINKPDSVEINSDFQINSLYLGGKRVTIGLPSMPNYNLGALEGSACDTLTSVSNEQLSVNSIVRIYPNPSQQELTIEILNGVKPKSITVTDATGKEIMKINSTKPSTQVNISSLSAGLYFVKVQERDGSVTVKKFVKE